MLIGYARVSTVDQNLALQHDTLTDAGCAKIFTEQMSGAVTERSALHDALEFTRSGDTLMDNGKDSLREFTQEPSHPGATAASELAAERAAARVA